MVFILNREINFKKNILKCFMDYYGIGRTYAEYLCIKVGVSEKALAKNLPRRKLRKLSRILYLECLTGVELKRLQRSNIGLKVKIKSYQGFRHTVGLPVNGQNTKNNRKTARKLLRMTDRT